MHYLPRWIEAVPSSIMVSLVMALIFSILVPVAVARPVDGDEGYYLLAARLVTEGKQLYHHFFYPQMPLLPYVYGWWMQLTSFSWYAARFLSVLLATVLGVLIYHQVVTRTRRQSLGLAAALLYVFSTTTLQWYTVAKTYTLSTLLLFAAYVVLLTAHKRLWPYALSGLLFGVAVETRLFFLGVLLAFSIHIVRQVGPSLWRSPQLALFITGIGVALLPSGALAVQDSDTFIFNNLTYHQERADIRGADALKQKSEVALIVLGLAPYHEFSRLQPLLLTLTLLATAWLAVRRVAPSFAQLIVLVLFLLSLLPTPTHIQYFSTLTPFVIVASFEALQYFQPSPRMARAAVAFGVLYCVVGLPPMLRLVNPEPSEWDIPLVRSVSATINQLTEPGDLVLTWWPGYLLETHTRNVPNLENNFGVEAAAKVVGEKHPQYHLLTEAGIKEQIRQQVAPVVVYGNLAKEESNYPDVIRQAGYVLDSKIHNAEFYKLQ